MKSIREIREYSGLSRAEFSRTYQIPLRTLEDWESEKHKAPAYVSEMLRQIVIENAELKQLDCYSNTSLHELGYCYTALLYVLNKNGNDPYPASDIFPIKYFTIVYKRATSLRIPPELNERIGRLLKYINMEQWEKTINIPTPMEKRGYFLMGCNEYRYNKYTKAAE